MNKCCANNAEPKTGMSRGYRSIGWASGLPEQGSSTVVMRALPAAPLAGRAGRGVNRSRRNRARGDRAGRSRARRSRAGRESGWS